MTDSQVRSANVRMGPIHFNFENASGYLTALAARTFASKLASELHPLGLKPGQFPILLLLAKRDNQSPNALAKYAHLSEPTVIRTLDRMERDGLIIRQRVQHDHRRVYIELTVKGRALVDPAMLAAFKVGAQALAGFTSQERDTLNTLLRRAIRNLGQESK